MSRHEVSGVDGHAAVETSIDGEAIVLNLYGPKGGHMAGLGFWLERVPALWIALDAAAKDGPRVEAQTRVRRERQELELDRLDTVVRCTGRCRRRRKVAFSECIADWPRCCGQLVELCSTNRDLRQEVADALRELTEARAER